VSDSSLDDVAYSFGKRLETSGWVVGTAESCTGGLVARALTERSGSSAWFDRGVVTYSNDAKMALLNVPDAIITMFGAVSEQCASKMSLGLLAQLGIARGATVWKPAIAISVTGIAGPTGEVPGKPVGTVCFGCALRAVSKPPQDIFLEIGLPFECKQRCMPLNLQRNFSKTLGLSTPLR
jgi:nicotinamide-nucleotide amidase